MTTNFRPLTVLKSASPSAIPHPESWKRIHNRLEAAGSFAPPVPPLGWLIPLSYAAVTVIMGSLLILAWAHGNDLIKYGKAFAAPRQNTLMLILAIQYTGACGFVLTIHLIKAVRSRTPIQGGVL